MSTAEHVFVPPEGSEPGRINASLNPDEAIVGYAYRDLNEILGFLREKPEFGPFDAIKTLGPGILTARKLLRGLDARAAEESAGLGLQQQAASRMIVASLPWRSPSPRDFLSLGETQLREYPVEAYSKLSENLLTNGLLSRIQAAELGSRYKSYIYGESIAAEPIPEDAALSIGVFDESEMTLEGISPRVRIMISEDIPVPYRDTVRTLKRPIMVGELSVEPNASWLVHIDTFSLGNLQHLNEVPAERFFTDTLERIERVHG